MRWSTLVIQPSGCHQQSVYIVLWATRTHLGPGDCGVISKKAFTKISRNISPQCRYMENWEMCKVFHPYLSFTKPYSWGAASTPLLCMSILWIIEGSLEVKLPTIWTDGEGEVGRVREEKRRRKKIREEKESEERRCRCAKKVEKSRSTVFFQWFGAQEGRKVGSLKQRVRSHLAGWEGKSARRCGTKHISKSKRTKHLSFRALLGIKLSKKCTPSCQDELMLSQERRVPF